MDDGLDLRSRKGAVEDFDFVNQTIEVCAPRALAPMSRLAELVFVKDGSALVSSRRPFT